MNELKVFNYNQMEVVDSREVAKLVEKQHKHLLRDIDGYIKIMEEATEPKVGPSDFFIKSAYKDSTGRTLPCYLLTKKGCDMVANKMTGEKGVLFTAAYVTAFENMREKIACGSLENYSAELHDLTAAVQLLTEQVETLVNRESGPAAALAVPELETSAYWKVPQQVDGPAARKRWMRTVSEKLELLAVRLRSSSRSVLYQIYHVLESEHKVSLDEERIRVIEEYRLDDCSILASIFYNETLKDAFQRVVDHNLAPENRGW